MLDMEETRINSATVTTPSHDSHRSLPFFLHVGTTSSIRGGSSGSYRASIVEEEAINNSHAEVEVTLSTSLVTHCMGGSIFRQHRSVHNRPGLFHLWSNKLLGLAQINYNNNNSRPNGAGLPLVCKVCCASCPHLYNNPIFSQIRPIFKVLELFSPCGHFSAMTNLFHSHKCLIPCL